MLRYGTITEIDANKGLARVKFPEDGIVSGWLQVLQKNTLKNKQFHTFDVDEHVACLMDENAENGVIMGAVYSKNEAPGAVKGANISGVEFEDGTKIQYDRSSNTLTIDCVGDVTVICQNATVTASDTVTIDCPKTEITGDVEIGGKLDVTDNISTPSDVVAGLIHLKTHKHTGVVPGGGVSATPIP